VAAGGQHLVPGKDLSGRPEVVVAFPDLALDRADVAVYLVQRPNDDEADDAWTCRPTPGDQEVTTVTTGTLPGRASVGPSRTEGTEQRINVLLVGRGLRDDVA
jgi:hypothetical protein